jgi:hypothetical protein
MRPTTTVIACITHTIAGCGDDKPQTTAPNATGPTTGQSAQPAKAAKAEVVVLNTEGKEIRLPCGVGVWHWCSHMRTTLHPALRSSVVWRRSRSRSTGSAVPFGTVSQRRRSRASRRAIRRRPSGRGW